MQRFLPFLAAVMLFSWIGAQAEAPCWLPSPAEPTYAVCDYTGTITLTLLGDCTLGGEEAYRRYYTSLESVVRREGAAWPFAQLSRLTATDDITVANLEGVLSDRELKKEDKQFCFIGPASMTDILTLGSVEAVTLANNHAHDYGDDGLFDTRSALENAGVCWFDTTQTAIWERDGLRIGFAAAFYSASGSRGKALREQIAALKDAGCAAVITVMHAGEEYDSEISGYQKQIAKAAVEAGSCLVVGHHPHIVQGWSLMNGVPVVYSLGNCVFGGNKNPKDKDALALQAVLSFDEGELIACELHFYPLCISTETDSNTYSPIFQTPIGADRVLKKMEKSTGTVMPEWDRENGAVVRVVFTGNE